MAPRLFARETLHSLRSQAQRTSSESKFSSRKKRPNATCPVGDHQKVNSHVSSIPSASLAGFVSIYAMLRSDQLPFSCISMAA